MTSTYDPMDNESAGSASENVDPDAPLSVRLKKYDGRPRSTREARRAADYAYANGLIGFRANWEKFSSSIYNTDPPMRLVVARIVGVVKRLKELEGKALTYTSPVAEGMLLTLPMSRDKQDPRGFLVVIPLTDYLELVARARKLVFDD